MPSNAWTERRRVLRRPIVCNSKKKTDDATQALIKLTLTLVWSGVDGLWQTSLSTTEDAHRIGTSNLWAGQSTDAVSNIWNWQLVLTSGLIPIFFTANTNNVGPTPHQVSGTGPLWDGSVPTILGPFPVLLTPGLGGGQVTVGISALP